MTTLTCPQARGLIFDYLDGELDPSTARAVERHRDACTNCPPLATALVVLLDRLHNLPPVTPDDRWLADLQRRFAATPRSD